MFTEYSNDTERQTLLVSNLYVKNSMKSMALLIFEVMHLESPFISVPQIYEDMNVLIGLLINCERKQMFKINHEMQ